MTKHQVVLGDATQLNKVQDESVDLVFADPPYNLSKEKPLESDFTKYTTMDKQWDIMSHQDYFRFTTSWLSECYKKMKPGASIFICGSFHNIFLCHDVGVSNGFKLVSFITWAKTSAPPSITRRQPTQSTEFLLWFSKGKNWKYNYQEAKKFNDGKQLRDFWVLNPARGEETKFGKWRSQKPIELVSRCIEIASDPDDLVLDIFSGSGTTSYCCMSLDRKSIAYENNSEAFNIIAKRLQSTGKSFSMAFDNKTFSAKIDKNSDVGKILNSLKEGIGATSRTVEKKDTCEKAPV